MLTVLRNTVLWGLMGIIAVGLVLVYYGTTMVLAILIFVNPYPIGIWVLFGVWIFQTTFAIALTIYLAERGSNAPSHSIRNAK